MDVVVATFIVLSFSRIRVALPSIRPYTNAIGSTSFSSYQWMTLLLLLFLLHCKTYLVVFEYVPGDRSPLSSLSARSTPVAFFVLSLFFPRMFCLVLRRCSSI